MSPTRPSLHLAGLLALALAPLAACTKDNPNHCADGDTRPECTVDARPIDAAEGCTEMPSLCTADESCVDDVCVDCNTTADRQSADCDDPAAPVCGANRDCRACAADTECDSELCDHGACAPDGQVLFVKHDGDDSGGNDCLDSATPCKTLTHALTLVPTGAATADNLRYIKMLTRGDYVEPNVVTISDKLVVIIGAPLAGSGSDRSVIDRMGNGPSLVINTGANVRLEQLAVNNGTNNLMADGITCSGATLVADGILVDNNNGTGIVGDACELTLRNSTVMRNDEGGIAVAGGGRAVVVNNIIVDNGGGMSDFGGLRIGAGVESSSVIQANTVVANNSVGSDGITCVLPAITVLDTIIFGDAAKPRVSGTCVFDHTLYGPDDPGALLGTARGNMLVPAIADFKFQAAGDYHIKADSVAKGKGTVTGLAPEAAKDMDGQVRPQGAPDVGADEIPD